MCQWARMQTQNGNTPNDYNCNFKQHVFSNCSLAHWDCDKCVRSLKMQKMWFIATEFNFQLPIAEEFRCSNMKYAILLRDPLERISSHANMHHITMVDVENMLLDPLKEFPYNNLDLSSAFFSNLFVRELSQTYSTYNVLYNVTQHDFIKALDRLAKFDVVSCLDTMDSPNVQSKWKQLGFTKGQYPLANKKKYHNKTLVFSKLVLDSNYWDIELYKLARQKYC